MTSRWTEVHILTHAATGWGTHAAGGRERCWSSTPRISPPRRTSEDSRDSLHPVERYTRVDTNMLERDIMIDDPTTWTRPWTVRIELRKMDEKTLVELRCGTCIETLPRPCRLPH